MKSVWATYGHFRCALPLREELSRFWMFFAARAQPSPDLEVENPWNRRRRNVRVGSWLCENVRPTGWDFEALGFGGAAGWI